MSKKLVAFKAAWCGPCKALEPTLNELKDEGYEVLSFDVDEHTDFAREAGVRSVPTMLVMEDDAEVYRFIGNQSKGKILEQLKP